LCACEFHIEENTSAHTDRCRAACDFRAWKSTRQAASQISFDGFARVDKCGNIRKPTDYRDFCQNLGTYFVLDPKGGNQMHLTYTSPGAADYYRRHRNSRTAGFW
jgi:hypothetical protein